MWGGKREAASTGKGEARSGADTEVVARTAARAEVENEEGGTASKEVAVDVAGGKRAGGAGKTSREKRQRLLITLR